MNEKLVSEGKCLFCEEVIAQARISNHLASHLTQMEKEDSGKNQVNYWHLAVDGAEMFLHLLVRSSLTMKRVDSYLRDIWLECCGHMSSFGYKNTEIGMNNKVGDVFKPKLKIFHDYDFGSTTRVFLQGKKQYSLNLSEDIILLSRNEPLNLMCATCKSKPAVNLCTVCSWDGYAFFCKSCSKKHAETCEDFDDYSQMPVVNSPRMGVCGYTGGAIDFKRDGVYKK